MTFSVQVLNHFVCELFQEQQWRTQNIRTSYTLSRVRCTPCDKQQKTGDKTTEIILVNGRQVTGQDVAKRGWNHQGPDTRDMSRRKFPYDIQNVYCAWLTHSVHLPFKLDTKIKILQPCSYCSFKILAIPCICIDLYARQNIINISRNVNYFLLGFQHSGFFGDRSWCITQSCMASFFCLNFCYLYVSELSLASDWYYNEQVLQVINYMVGVRQIESLFGGRRGEVCLIGLRQT